MCHLNPNCGKDTYSVTIQDLFLNKYANARFCSKCIKGKDLEELTRLQQQAQIYLEKTERLCSLLRENGYEKYLDNFRKEVQMPKNQRDLFPKLKDIDPHIYYGNTVEEFKSMITNPFIEPEGITFDEEEIWFIRFKIGDEIHLVWKENRRAFIDTHPNAIIIDDED